MSELNYDRSVLIDACAKIGINLNNQQVDQFLIYYEHLV